MSKLKLIKYKQLKKTANFALRKAEHEAPAPVLRLVRVLGKYVLSTLAFPVLYHMLIRRQRVCA
jgi:hypothetical protein